MDTSFYVGTPGSMVALPDVYSPVDAPVTRIGASSRSLGGNQWRDTLGYRRSWTWKWENLLPAHRPYVDALMYDLVPGPLRLIDPRRANRLPEQVASGGSVMRSTQRFAVTAGGTAYRDLRTATATDPTSLGPARLLRGCVEWLRTGPGTGTLYLSGSEADGTWRLPLTPLNEPLQLSCWVAGNSGVTVGLEWTEYDAAGVGTGFFSDAGGDTVQLSSSQWQLLTVNIAPDPASVSLSPRLTTDAAQPSGSVLSTAWQIAALDAETGVTDSLSGDCAAPELADGWRTGGGAPYVVVDPGGYTYTLPGFTDVGLVLTET